MDNLDKAIFSFMFDDDSDDEHHQRVIEAIVHHTSQENEATKHGGSGVGRVYKNREREDRHRNLMSDYFIERPHFNATNFPDTTDEYCRLVESTALESLQKFCCAVEAVYGQWYPRFPNPADLYKLLHKASNRGFPEAVASYDTWIWHAFFGAAGSNNDINILACSPLFNDVVRGVAPHVEYIVNENQYHLSYYLANGIYPHWATLVKTVSSPDNPKKRLFAQMQEAYKKNVEREFGILQARWAIVRGPACMWCKDNLHSIMMTCIILHNMIVEDEYEYVEEECDDEDMCSQRSRRARAKQYELEPSITYEYHQDRHTLSDYMIRHNRVRSPHVHQSLQNDLINHL
ncbi:PREDICTED: uncharacterized protein LOC103322723 [Prunus mume]|uniref:Uncharacterized protein LOC103322723 n=1 Tax=Prunus mume TaxID=102107 RepID=A0ABM0NCS7_PRUMU|nr:PREDICTED: uncharacterized protein LOC103322723 [Prunus mume]